MERICAIGDEHKGEERRRLKKENKIVLAEAFTRGI